MKIKVDKEEYERLLERVEELEGRIDSTKKDMLDLFDMVDKHLEGFLEHKCQVVMIKRDKEQLVAELRAQVMNNIFKESK